MTREEPSETPVELRAYGRRTFLAVTGVGLSSLLWAKPVWQAVGVSAELSSDIQRRWSKGPPVPMMRSPERNLTSRERSTHSEYESNDSVEPSVAPRTSAAAARSTTLAQGIAGSIAASSPTTIAAATAPTADERRFLRQSARLRSRAPSPLGCDSCPAWACGRRVCVGIAIAHINSDADACSGRLASNSDATLKMC